VTGQVSVQAGWAIWSKRPGTRDDFSVLAASAGPLSSGEFAQLLAHFAPGNASAEPDTPASLPWVTLSRFAISDELYLGISVQTPTEDRDGTGRPISRTSYYCVPYRELTRAPVSYQGLYAAVTGQAPLPHEGGGLVPLAIPRLDPAGLARAVRGFGEMTVATAAALLLAGPVTITGPGFPDLETRLRFYDAVAALLPYGYRSYLTAATWSDTGAGDRFRIVFANRPRDEASQLPWGALPRPPAAGPAATYFGYLQRVLDRAAGGDSRLELLIGHLAHESEPHKLEEPEHAVGSLHGFLLPVILVEGKGSRADVRQIFATGRVRELPVPQRAGLLKRLISLADPQDLGMIGQWYDESAAVNPGELFAGVAVACRGHLWSPAGSAGLARDYLRFMDPRGRADELLARIVAQPEATPDPVPGLDAVGRLLTEFVIDAPAGTTSYPQTQQALMRNAAAGAALLTDLAAAWAPGTGRLDRAAAWLEPVADRVVRPFVSLLGEAFGARAEPVDAAALYELNRDGDQASVRYLLLAASYRHLLHLVLPALASWLASDRLERGVLTEQASRYWREVAMELAPTGLDEAVWLDLALLSTHNDPRGLLSGRYGQPEFSQRLAAAWRELATEAQRRRGAGHAVDELLENGLIAFLERTPWRSDPTLAAAVHDLASSLTVDAPRARLMTLVHDVRESLRQMPPEATPAQIAQACTRARHEGLTPVQAGEALARSGAVGTGKRAADVLEELQRTSFNLAIDYAQMFTRGVFGAQVAREFPPFVAVRSSEQISFRLNVLGIAASSTAPDAPPAIGADTADYLDRCGHALEEVVKNARKGPRGGLAGRFFGGGKPGEAPPGGPPAQGAHAAQGAQTAQGTPPAQGTQHTQGGPEAQDASRGPGGQGGQA
jgi:hypothetical protein